MVLSSQLMQIILMILALLAIAVFLDARRRASHAPARRFGREYERVVDQLGRRSKAETELRARQRRGQELHIRPLSHADAARFHQAWKSLQARFVDHPAGSLVEADLLVRELMQKRGYPMGAFERRAADISVDHPGMVDHYRAAHEIALRDRRGDVNTERMRQAVIHYRALFSELLDTRSPPPINAS